MRLGFSAGAVLLGALCLGAGSSAAAAEHVPGRVLVKLRGLPGGLPAALSAERFSALSAPQRELLARHGARGARRVFAEVAEPRSTRTSALLGRAVAVPDLYGWMIVEVSSSADIPALARELARDPLVEAAEPDLLLSPLAVPNDPSFASQWHHRNTGQSGGVSGDDVKSVEAWDRGVGSTATVVAVLDTGIELTHPDLVANIGPGYDYIDGDSTPNDADGHGTHVAGIIAAAGDNGAGTAGLMWRAKIMPVRVCSSLCPETAIANGLRFAADNGARVVNMSLGGAGFSSIMYDAVNYADALGVLLVAAAGNSDTQTPSYPAYFSNVIAVAATDDSDRKASFSNYGTWVDIAAPGNGVFSTYLGGGYASLSGTSMASPMVAGAAGLIFANRPDWTSAQVRSQLLSTAQNINAQNPGYAGLLGSGRLNARDALPLQFQVIGLALTPDEPSLGNGAVVAFSAVISTNIPASQLRVTLGDQSRRELGRGTTVSYTLTDPTHVSGSLQLGSLSLNHSLAAEVHLLFVFGAGAAARTQDVRTWSFQEVAVLPPGGRAAVWNAVFDPNEGGSATVRATLEQAGRVSVRIYRGDGTLVRRLADEDCGIGVKSWDWNGRNDDGVAAAGGIYLIHIRGPGLAAVKRVVVVR